MGLKPFWAQAIWGWWPFGAQAIWDCGHILGLKPFGADAISGAHAIWLQPSENPGTARFQCHTGGGLPFLWGTQILRFGFAAATRCVQNGMRTALLDVSAQELQEAEAKLSGVGKGQVVGVLCNVTSPEDCAKAVATVGLRKKTAQVRDRDSAGSRVAVSSDRELR